MPTFIPSALTPAAPQPTVQNGALPGARGRADGDDDARGFGAVLERSRAGARRSQDRAEAGEAQAPAAPQKPGRGAARKEEPGSELLTIALFAPQIQAHAARAQASAAAAAGRVGTTAGSTAAALPGTPDAALASAPAPVDAPSANGAAEALATATEAAAADAKTLQADAGTAAAPSAEVSAAPTDPVASLPLAPSAIEKADAAAPQGASAPAVPPAGTQPSARGQAATRSAAAGAADSAAPTPSSPALAEGAAAQGSSFALPVPAAAQQADTQTGTQAAALPTVPAPGSAMQPALDRAPPPTAGTAAPALAPPVGSSEWAPALGHQMLRMRAGGQQVAELSLNPAGLGPLKITLGMGDSQVQAMFVSAHESVRKAVEAALPQLRSTLAEQGISLGQTSVGAESRPWAGMGGFAQQQEQRQPSPGPASARPGAARGDTVAAPMPARTTSSRIGTVDTFA
ncbi:hypothetical protein GCM10023165_34520 [Variovorax defluvii]|uniref:Flagellar hook-length control protein-like C-terminal domain-containing protein n=1 Tax=Variovorax defluvii TaxID=913761 RepID=A0ABP8I0F1_9BURK